MKDTIHLGWLGWLAFDKAVDPFLSNPTPAPTYHLNERFFSKDWATYDGDVKDISIDNNIEEFKNETGFHVFS